MPSRKVWQIHLFDTLKAQGACEADFDKLFNKASNEFHKDPIILEVEQNYSRIDSSSSSSFNWKTWLLILVAAAVGAAIASSIAVYILFC